MSIDHELAIPPAAYDDADSFEILRVWASGGRQHVTIQSGLRGGPEGFGFMLAQLARHGANLISQRDGVPRREALRRIKSSLDEEWHDATTLPTGQIPE